MTSQQWHSNSIHAGGLDSESCRSPRARGCSSNGFCTLPLVSRCACGQSGPALATAMDRWQNCGLLVGCMDYPPVRYACALDLSVVDVSLAETLRASPQGFSLPSSHFLCMTCAGISSCIATSNRAYNRLETAWFWGCIPIDYLPPQLLRAVPKPLRGGGCTPCI